MNAQSHLRSAAAAASLYLLLAACNSNPPKGPVCSAPGGNDLEQALEDARYDMKAGCESQFDRYFVQLLTIAEGDPKPENAALFSDYLVWASEEGLLSKRQAQLLYNRYFSVKYVTLMSDYSVCSETCRHQPEVLRDMRAELGDKEQGLLKVSANNTAYRRASRLFQEAELVLDATCASCGQAE